MAQNPDSCLDTPMTGTTSTDPAEPETWTEQHWSRHEWFYMWTKGLDPRGGSKKRRSWDQRCTELAELAVVGGCVQADPWTLLVPLSSGQAAEGGELVPCTWGQEAQSQVRVHACIRSTAAAARLSRVDPDLASQCLPRQACLSLS